jgi:hypothetical protein
VTDGSPRAVESLGLVERVSALHRVELFARVPGRVLAAVAQAAVEDRLEPGEILMEEGAVEAHLYAVVDGRVRVHRGDRTLVELVSRLRESAQYGDRNRSTPSCDGRTRCARREILAGRKRSAAEGRAVTIASSFPRPECHGTGSVES